ncbi:MAG: hypothetical protein Q8L36_01670 [bacterium]|nr:hypothetical protein [bacterium]
MSTVPVGSGGTGAVSLTGILKGNGTSSFTAITGAANYLTKWSDANTIGTSTLYELSGSIGIATTTPSYVLDVVGTAQFSQPIIVGTPTLNGHATTKSYVDSVLTAGTATGTLANLTVTGTTTLATTAGRVGIGTTTPSQKLEVNGNISINGSGLSGGISLILKRDGAGADWRIIQGHTGSNDLSFMETVTSPYSQNTYVTFKDGGNVGIGTTTPQTALHVIGTSTISGNALIAGNVGIRTTTPQNRLHVKAISSVVGQGQIDVEGAAGGYGAGVLFTTTASDTGAYKTQAKIVADGSGNYNSGAGSYSSKLTFWTLNADSLTEKMSILASGNVGIGTTTPATALHVIGTSTISGNALIAGNVGIGTTTPLAKLSVVGTDTSIGYFTNTGASGSGAGAGMIGYSDDGAALVSGDRLGFFLLGGSRDTAHALSNSVGIAGIAAENWNATSTGGDLTFETTPKTTNTRTEKMRITSEGKIGIVTTTPSYTLDVVGTAQFSQPIIVGTPTLNGHATTKSYVDSVLTGGTATGTLANLTVTGTTTLATTAGRVGIGTTTPQYKLDINGDLRVNTSSTLGNVISGVWNGTAISDSYISSAVNWNSKATSSITITGTSGLSGGGDLTANRTLTLNVGNANTWTAAQTFTTSSFPLGIWNALGNVGIGTTTPGAKLDINGLTSNAVLRFTNTAAGAEVWDFRPYILGVSNGGFSIYNQTSLKTPLVIAVTTGYLGIGTTTPSYALDVVGTAQFSQPILVGTPTVAGHATTKSYVDSVLTGGTATGTLANLTVTGTTTLATTAGNVGIGTTTPASKLTVAGVIRSTTGGFIFPDASTQTTAFTGTVGASAVSSGIFGSGIGNYTFGSATLQPILFVDSSGEKVGVGTSTPSSKLNVAGTANAVQLIINANATQSNSNPLVQLRKSDSSVLSSWHSDSAQNLFLGYLNGVNNNISGTGSEGLDNIFIGYRTGNGNTTGTRNTALGSEALEYNSTGYFNTAMGSFASHYNTTGVNNSSFGYFANYQNQTGTTNSAFGAEAGYSNTSGSGNVFLGYRAGYNETGSNKLYIANSSTNPPLIFGDFSSAKIGLGTTTPAYSLHVEGSGYFSQPVLVGTPTVAGHAATKSYVDSVLTTGTATGTLANLIVSGTTTLATTGGNVGIGTVNPSAKLGVDGDILVSGNAAFGNFNSFNTNCASIGFVGCGVNTLQIQGSLGVSGDIAIGATSTPGAGLDVFSSSIFRASSSFGGPIVIGTTTLPNDAQVPLVVRGTSSFIGRIGIGTSNPSYELSFDGDAAHTIGGERRISSGAGFGLTIQASGASSTSNAAGGSLTLSGGISTGNASSSIQFYTATAGGSGSTARTPSVKMTLTGGGSLGIGTANPSYTLDVSGTGQFSQPLLVGTPTLDGHATTKSYTDPYMVFLKVTGSGSTTAYSAINGNVGIGDFSGGAAKAKLEVKGGVRLNTTEAKPTCDSNQRGTFWHTQGGVLIKDNVEVCVKTGSDTYVWSAIY